MMFENVDEMRTYLEARGLKLKNERMFVGQFCSFFTQHNEVHGLSGMAMDEGAPPDFRAHILVDGKMLLVFPTAKEVEIAGPNRLFVDVDLVAAADAWGIPEIAYMPSACVHVKYDNPLVVGAE